jgi:hypothetical protein
MPQAVLDEFTNPQGLSQCVAGMTLSMAGRLLKNAKGRMLIFWAPVIKDCKIRLSGC